MAPSNTTDLGIPGISHPHLRLIDDTDCGAENIPRPRRTTQTPSDEAKFFLGCGIGKPHVHAAAMAARANATTIEAELLAEGLIDPELYYRWLASEIGLSYIEHIDPGEVIKLPSMDVLLQRDGPLRISREHGQVAVIVPEARKLEAHKARLQAQPALRDTLAVSSPATIRKAVWQAGADDRVRKTTFQLDQDDRDVSARRVMTGSQGFVLAMALYFGMTGLALWPFFVLTALHVVLTLFFCGGILLRITALTASVLRPVQRLPRDDKSDTSLPVYTVLIALHDEAGMAPAIVSRISALHWPKSLLDIKYVCEADDELTISALQAQNLGPECEIVRTPDFGPKTKPKALQYALQGARGSLIAVYDAEDKPAPGQLQEAWTTFRNGHPAWAAYRLRWRLPICVQAGQQGCLPSNTVACSVF